MKPEHIEEIVEEDWHDNYISKTIELLENNQQETLKQCKIWQEDQDEKIEKLREEAESKTSVQCNVSTALIQSPKKYNSEVEYLCYLIAFSIKYFATAHEGVLEEVKERTDLPIGNFLELRFNMDRLGNIRNAAAYSPSYNVITVQALPEGFLDEPPLPLKPLKYATRVEGMNETELKTTLLHEGTHAVIENNTPETDREVYDAINEAASRTVSLVIGEGNRESPATGYRSDFDISIMQAAEQHFSEIAETENDKFKTVSRIREEAINIENKAAKYPERDIISLLNAEEDEEVRKIKSVVYIFEMVEAKTYLFLANYGLSNYLNKNKISKVHERLDNEILKNVDTKSSSETLFKSKAEKEYLGPNLRELKDISGLSPEEATNLNEEDTKKFFESAINERDPNHNLLKQFAESRKHLIQVLDEIKQEIAYLKEKNGGKDVLEELEKDKENIEEIIELMGEMLSESQKDKKIEKRLEETDEKLLRGLESSDIKEILTDPNRTSTVRLKRVDKDLTTLLLETIEAYKVLLNEHQEINKHVLNFCQALNGDIRFERELYNEYLEVLGKKRQIGQTIKYHSEASSEGAKKVIEKHIEDTEAEKEEIEKLFEITEELHELCKFGHYNVGKSIKALEEAERKIEGPPNMS